MLYSDGLIEGFSGPDREDRLWTDGLLELLDKQRDTELSVVPTRLAERAIELNGGPLGDDVAILLLTAGETGEPGEPGSSADPSESAESARTGAGRPPA
jgi:hypothetical protein